MGKYIIKVAIVFSLFNCSGNNNFNNSESGIYKKVDSLMSLMTLKEKIGQTIMYSGDWVITRY